MKKYASLLILMLLTFVGFSQKLSETPKVKWGEEYKRPNFTAIEKIITSDNSGTYAWRNKSGSLTSREVIIERYDENLKLDKSSVLNIPFSVINNNVEVIDIFPFAGKIITLTSFYNSADNRNTLFAQTIDRTTLQLNNDRKEVAVIEAKRRGNKGSFTYEISRDSSKLLVYSDLPFKFRGGERLSLNVYNQALEKQWQKQVELPFRDNNFTMESIEVAPDGNVYLLGKIIEDRPLFDLNFNAPNYDYVVVAYTNNGNDMKQYDVSLGNDFITDLTIRVDNKGDLICAGFYSERSSRNMKGAFFSKINASTKKMYDIKKGEFSSAFLEQFMSKRRARKKRELFSYRIDELVLRSDGGALMVAEQFYVRVTTQTDPSGFQMQTTTYYYNDIITVNINPDGTIAWATKIPKRQVDGTGVFSSYAMTISKGKIYFIYNDHPKNLTRTNYRKIKNFNGKRSIVTLATLSPDGSYKKTPLVNNRDERIITRPQIARQVTSDELILFGTYNKRYKFGLVKF
jgi:hypothetical protein